MARHLHYYFSTGLPSRLAHTALHLLRMARNVLRVKRRRTPRRAAARGAVARHGETITGNDVAAYGPGWLNVACGIFKNLAKNIKHRRKRSRRRHGRHDINSIESASAACRSGAGGVCTAGALGDVRASDSQVGSLSYNRVFCAPARMNNRSWRASVLSRRISIALRNTHLQLVAFVNGVWQNLLPACAYTLVPVSLAICSSNNVSESAVIKHRVKREEQHGDIAISAAQRKMATRRWRRRHLGGRRERRATRAFRYEQ